jgi:hypothetical protein
MLKVLLLLLLGFLCFANPSRAAPLSVNWEISGGVDSVFAGGASISFAPIRVKSLDSVSVSGYWTNLADTRFSSLRAEIRLRIGGNWQTVAFNDHVRGAYGSTIDFSDSDFEILPIDLSFGFVDGIIIGPNSVIYSGLGGLNGGDGTNFAFSTVQEPESLALVLASLVLLAALARNRKEIAGVSVLGTSCGFIAGSSFSTVEAGE